MKNTEISKPYQSVFLKNSLSKYFKISIKNEIMPLTIAFKINTRNNDNQKNEFYVYGSLKTIDPSETDN